MMGENEQWNFVIMPKEHLKPKHEARGWSQKQQKKVYEQTKPSEAQTQNKWTVDA